MRQLKLTIFFVLITLSACTSPPLITSFTASSTEVLPGESVTLQWSADGGANVTINPQVGGVSPSGRTETLPLQETTTFALTATKGGQTDTRELTVTVQSEPVVDDLPEIKTFDLSPLTVKVGQQATLSWDVDNASSVTITELGAQAAQGTTTVSKTEVGKYSYTLTAENSKGKLSKTVVLTVSKGPSIISFEAAPTKIGAGQSVTLGWNVSGAEKLFINQSVGEVTGTTSVTVTPEQDTTYTLSATDAKNETSTAQVSVEVVPAPTIVSFTVSPDTIDQGDSATLSWRATGEGAVTVSVSPNVVGSGRGPIDSVLVTPNETTTYTLTATNEFGLSSAATTTLTVRPPLPAGNITLLIAGQSNAVGQGELENIEPPDPDVRMLGNDYKWKTATEPVDSNQDQVDRVSRDSNPGHSFGVRLGKKLHNATNKKVYLIPSALGGSSVSPGSDNENWIPSGSFDRNDLFGSANYRAHVSAGKVSSSVPAEGGPVTGLIWYQGESTQPNEISTYVSNTNTVMDKFMSELDQNGDTISGVPVVYMQLARRLESGPDNLRYQQVRELQRQMETGAVKSVAQRNNYYMVVTHDLPMFESNHLSAEGQKLLGDRIALAYREHVLNENIDGTGPRLEDITLSGNEIRVDTTQTINADNSYEDYFTVFINGSPKTVSGKGISVGRDPQDDTVVLITLSSTLSGSDNVQLRYMPPSFDPSSYPTSQLSDVIRGTSGLPLPAFGPIDVP